MKCICCSSLFEPTPEEELILRKSDTSYIPFCCEDCYRQYHGISARRSVPDKKLLFWHIGKKTSVKYGGCSSDGLVRPITSTDLQLIQKYRGRSWLDYEQAEISEPLLPSEKVFGKCYWHK